tara:strand:+ start:1332 stop:2018 length:687 start_codon:yes stop_codon:yes gene_type:complete
MIKFLIITSLLLFSGLVFAEPAPFVQADGDSSVGNLIAIIYAFIYYIGILIGFIFILLSFLKLMNSAENRGDPKNTMKSALLTMLAGALLYNIHGTFSTITATFTGASEICFVENQSLAHERLTPTDTSACFDAETSEITQSLRSQLTGEDQSWEELKGRINLLFAVLQTISLFFFIKAVTMLKAVSEGSQDASYGKIFVMLIFSSIGMDLSGFLEMIINTYQEIKGG